MHTPLPYENDVRLREALIAGSQQALTDAYDAYAGNVFGIALQITRDRGAAEDITQDVIVELWQRPERFDPHRAPLVGWLCMIARRRGIDWIRRRRAQETVRLATIEPPPPLFEDEMIDLTAGRQVRKAVADLPDMQRRAILLAYYEGLTYREVALALNIPEGTAKWRLRDGLHRLGERLRLAEGVNAE